MFQDIVLGIVQGLTEFLPVSSSGHLVIAQRLLGFTEHSLAKDLVAHLGTLVAVIAFYHRDLFSVLLGTVESLKTQSMNQQMRFTIAVIVASIPTGLAGILFKDYFEAAFENIFAVSIFFLVTAVLLLITHSVQKRSNRVVFDELSWKIALAIGVAQAFAIAPGISRAGATICAALLLGLSQRSAAFFSFAISIPAIVGASLLSLRHFSNESVSAWSLVTTFIISAVVGILALKLLVYFIKEKKLIYFSGYLFLLSSYILILGV